MSDRLYSTTKAGELLGGISQDDVRRLIRAGKLGAVPMVVRGLNKKPRKYVPESELQRFIQDLRGTLTKKLERIDRKVARVKAEPVTEYYK